MFGLLKEIHNQVWFFEIGEQGSNLFKHGQIIWIRSSFLTHCEHVATFRVPTNARVLRLVFPNCALRLKYLWVKPSMTEKVWFSRHAAATFKLQHRFVNMSTWFPLQRTCQLCLSQENYGFEHENRLLHKTRSVPQSKKMLAKMIFGMVALFPLQQQNCPRNGYGRVW